MTDRDQSIERGETERRELEAAGWEPKGEGAKTIWQSPTDGRWYAHYRAIEMQKEAEVGPEEERRASHTQQEAEPQAAEEKRRGRNLVVEIVEAVEVARGDYPQWRPAA
jgi:hypothetical protein